MEKLSILEEQLVTVEYKTDRGNIHSVKNLIPVTIQKGNFFAQDTLPQGMYQIEELLEMGDNERRKIIAKEINCPPYHWNNGKLVGADDLCEIRKCKFYFNCPITSYIMMAVDSAR